MREDVLGMREVCWGVGKYGEVRGSVFGVWENVFGVWGEMWKGCWGGGKGLIKFWEKCGTIQVTREVWGEGWCHDLRPQLS